MLVLEDLKYTEGHLWVKTEESGEATIGITDYGQVFLGKMVSVDLPEEGEEIVKDDVFGTAEGRKNFMELYSPLTGKVIAINELVLEEPELINSDPYDDGWLIKIKYSQPEEMDDLLSSDEYEAMVEELLLAQEDEEEDIDFEDEFEIEE